MVEAERETEGKKEEKEGEGGEEGEGEEGEEGWACAVGVHVDANAAFEFGVCGFDGDVFAHCAHASDDRT